MQVETASHISLYKCHGESAAISACKECLY